MTIEQQALALVNEVQSERNIAPDRIFQREFSTPSGEALCRALERHEAFRQEVSEAVKDAIEMAGWSEDAPGIRSHLSRFIIAPPVDPLVERIAEALGGCTSHAEAIIEELAKHGLAIRKEA